MIVTCDDERWESLGKMMKGILGANAEPCGETFDDATHRVICPHEALPPKLSLEELEGLAAANGISVTTKGEFDVRA